MGRTPSIGGSCFLVLFLALFGAVSLYGQEWGVVSANVGTLEIIRGGTALPLEVRAGTVVMEEDLLLTERRGAEIIGSQGARVVLEPNATLRLITGDSTGNLLLLSGAVTVALPRGGVDRELYIRSGALSSRLREGSLRIEALPGDRRLLTSLAGRHRVSSLEGEERFAEPSLLVGYDGRLRTVEVGAEGWIDRELEEFSARGPGFFAQRMREYLELRARFDSAYGALLEERELLGEWIVRYERGLAVEKGMPEGADQEFTRRATAALDLGDAMEERYYQLRMDLPYLSREYQEYLVQESSYLPGRLDFLRFLRAIMPLDDGGSESPEAP